MKILAELRSPKTWGTFFALIIIALFLLAIYQGVLFIANAQQPVAGSIIVAAIAIVGSVVTVVVGRVVEKQKEIDLKIREQKSRVYADLVNFLLDYMIRSKNESVDEKVVTDFFRKFAPDMILWSSSDFIAKWLAFRAHGGSPFSIVFAVDDILTAARRDLGHNDRKLRRLDLTKLFVNDLDEAVAQATTVQSSHGAEK